MIDLRTAPRPGVVAGPLRFSAASSRLRALTAVANMARHFLMIVAPVGGEQAWPRDMWRLPKVDCRKHMPHDPAHGPQSGLGVVDRVCRQDGFFSAVSAVLDFAKTENAVTVVCNHAKHRSPVVAAFAAQCLAEAPRARKPRRGGGQAGARMCMAGDRAGRGGRDCVSLSRYLSLFLYI